MAVPIPSPPSPHDPTTGRLVTELTDLCQRLPADKRGGAPALQWFVKQWLGDREILRMDPLCRGVHHHLLMLAWQDPTCGLPDDPQELQDWSDLERVALRFLLPAGGAASGGAADVDALWQRVWRQVGRVWHPVEGRLYNRGLLRARIQQLRYRLRSLAGVRARTGQGTSQKTSPATSPSTEPVTAAEPSDAESSELSGSGRAPPDAADPKSDLAVTTLPSASASASATASASASTASSGKPPRELHQLVEDALAFARDARTRNGHAARAARLLSAVLVPKSKVREKHTRQLDRWAKRGVDVETLLRHTVAVAARQELLGDPVRTWSYLHRCMDPDGNAECVEVEANSVEAGYVEHLRRRLHELEVPERARKLAEVALTVARTEADVVAVKRGMEGV